MPYNPLSCLWATATRRERPTGRVMSEGGCASNAVALRPLTREGAYLSFEEGLKGQLVADQFTDVAVLSGDSLATSGDALLDLR